MRFLREDVLRYSGDDCLPWPYARDTGGYGILRIGGQRHVVSRWVCEATNGAPPEPTYEATHSCGNGHLGCVTKRHLRWGTHAQNMAEIPIQRR